MPRPIRKEYVGAKYHVTARGNGRNSIFLGADDYGKFIEQLALALKKDGVVLYAYVVMPNHYHLLLETLRANLHAFMRRLNTAYSLYWRYKHRRPGHVFQGRYKAKLVSGDKYILALTRYIHLNPVKGERWNDVAAAERHRRLEQYPWSSYQAYTGRRREDLSFVNLRWLELMGGKTFPTRQKRYRAYINCMILKDDEALLKILSASRYAVGDEKFITEIEDELKSKRRGDIRERDIEWPKDDFIGLNRINEAVSEICGVEKEQLKSHGNITGEAKGLALELACSLGGITQRAAGEYYGGISCAAVGQQRLRLHNKMALDVPLRRKFEQLVSMLNV